jgi:hypothetical protein
MSKRALITMAIAITLIVIAGSAFWMRSGAGKYWRLERASQAFRNEQSDKNLTTFNSLRDELFAAGYLTNVSITITNAAHRHGQLVKRLSDALHGRDVLICKFTTQSNEVVIMTLPKNAAIVREALRE